MNMYLLQLVMLNTDEVSQRQKRALKIRKESPKETGPAWMEAARQCVHRSRGRWASQLDGKVDAWFR